jgi:simple sugar transport system permease protein
LPTLRGLLVGRPETGALFGAIIMFAVFSIVADNFLARPALASIMNRTAELGIVAMAITLLMIAGHFDLSVGSVLGMSSLLVPYLMVEQGMPSYLAVVIAFGVAMSIGVLNGLLVVTTRIPSFIVTLGTLLFWRGIVLVISEGFPILVPRDDPIFDFFAHRFGSGPIEGFNVSAIWFFATIVALTYVLLRTPWGNWIFAAGGNERSARAMGVPVDRLWIGLFVVTGLAAGLAGVIQVGRFNSVEPLRGEGLELTAIAAAVIGGARLNGGYGSVLGTALGALMIAMIEQGLVLSGVQSYWLRVAIGVLIIGAVIVNQIVGRSRPQV